MVTEDLLAVGALDLFGSSLVAVLAKTEDGVVILTLLSSENMQYKQTLDGD